MGDPVAKAYNSVWKLFDAQAKKDQNKDNF